MLLTFVLEYELTLCSADQVSVVLGHLGLQAGQKQVAHVVQVSG